VRASLYDSLVYEYLKLFVCVIWVECFTLVALVALLLANSAELPAAECALELVRKDLVVTVDAVGAHYEELLVHVDLLASVFTRQCKKLKALILVTFSLR